MTTIILDTSILLTALHCKIDLVAELNNLLDTNFTLSIIDKTLAELRGKKLEKLAKDYIMKHNITIIPTSQDKNVDNLILDHLTPATMVATQDRKLKEKLKKRKTAIITIRQQRYLALV